ncbi:MAG TPA: OmpP1/FadL family transporter [Thiolinea sp.]|nr:OmpP1/FadL family transporter [Thiolinea sp.]
MKKQLARTGLATIISGALLAGTAHAAGFALIENSASGMGNAFAGAAAIAEDPSTTWFNPAGMLELGPGTRTSVAGHIIIPSADYTDKGSWVNPTLTGGNISQAQTAMNGSNDDGGKVAVVPNSYLVHQVSDEFSLGLAINAPFGLETNYDNDWIGRYHALESAMMTLNVNPSFAYKVNDRFSIGAGLNAQYIDVKLSSAVDSAAACRSIASAANNGDLLLACLKNLPKLADAATDTKATISGDDLSWGYNIGAIYKITPDTRIGLSYRSAIDHQLTGDADYSVNAALQSILTATGVTRFNDTDVTAAANLPETASLSIAHRVNDRLELLGDFTRTGWSSFERLTVVNANDGSIVTDVNESWKDVNRYSIGGNYQYNDRTKLRFGVAYDETPVPNAQLLTPRTPDTDRTWVALGANYRINKQMSLDLGYAHLFMDQTAIDHTSEDNGYALRGLYDSRVDIVSAQFNWSF